MRNVQRLPSGQRKFHLRNLHDGHKAVNRRLVLGQSNKDIAREVGCSEQQVSIIRNSGKGIAHREGLASAADRQVAEVLTHIQETAFDNILELERIRANPSAAAAVRAKVSMHLLACAGIAPVQKVQIESQNVHLNGKDIEELKQRARDAGVLRNTPCEVKVVTS